MGDMLIDGIQNRVFVPSYNNPLHQSRMHTVNRFITQSNGMNHNLNNVGRSMLAASSSYMNMQLLSSSNSNGSAIQPTQSQDMVLLEVTKPNLPTRKSSLKVNSSTHSCDHYHGQHHLSQSSSNGSPPPTPTIPSMIKHVTWKTPEVEYPPSIAQGEALSSSLSAMSLTSPQMPLNLAGYFADVYCFSDDTSMEEMETKGPAVTIQVGNSPKTTIIAFTPRQRIFPHSAHIMRSNLGPLFKAFAAKENAKGVADHSLSSTSPIIGEHHTTPPRIEQKLGSPTRTAYHNTIVEPIGPVFVQHQDSDPPVTCQTPNYSGDKLLEAPPFDNHSIPTPTFGKLLTVKLDATITLPTTELCAVISPLGDLSAINEIRSNDQDITWEEDLFRRDEAPQTVGVNGNIFEVHADTYNSLGIKALIGAPKSRGTSPRIDIPPAVPAAEQSTAPWGPGETLPRTSVLHPLVFNHPAVAQNKHSNIPLPTHVLPSSHRANSSGMVTTPMTRNSEQKPTKRKHREERGQERPATIMQPDEGCSRKPGSSVPTTVEPRISEEGLNRDIQLQVGKRSGPPPVDKGVEVVGKRKREREAAVTVQPVLKAMRKEAPDKRQTSMLSGLDTDHPAQPWAPGAFIGRARRLSLDSSNTEPPRDPRRFKFLTLPLVIEWKTQLDRYSYLFQSGKVGQAELDKLEDVLLTVRANMDHPVLTAAWVKKAQLVIAMKKLRSMGGFNVPSKRVAREIVEFWGASPRFGMACM
jgi:hypothetical protein